MGYRGVMSYKGPQVLKARDYKCLSPLTINLIIL